MLHLSPGFTLVKTVRDFFLLSQTQFDMIFKLRVLVAMTFVFLYLVNYNVSIFWKARILGNIVLFIF